MRLQELLDTSTNLYGYEPMKAVRFQDVLRTTVKSFIWFKGIAWSRPLVGDEQAFVAN